MAQHEREPGGNNQAFSSTQPLPTEDILIFADQVDARPEQDPAVALRLKYKQGELSYKSLLAEGRSVSLATLMREAGTYQAGNKYVRAVYNRHQSSLPQVLCYRSNDNPNSPGYHRLSYRVLAEEAEAVRATLRAIAPQWPLADLSSYDFREPTGIIPKKHHVIEKRTAKEAAEQHQRLIRLFSEHLDKPASDEDIARLVTEILEAAKAADLIGEVWLRLQPYLRGERGNFDSAEKFLKLAADIAWNLRMDEGRQQTKELHHTVRFGENRPKTTPSEGVNKPKTRRTGRGLPMFERVSPDVVEAAFSRLTPYQQQALMLRETGLTNPKVAAKMGKSLPAVKMLIHRGRNSLKRPPATPEHPLKQPDRKSKRVIIDRKVEAEALAAAMAKLRPRQRKILELNQDHAYSEIAKKLGGVSLSAVSRRLCQARKALAWYLDHPEMTVMPFTCEAHQPIYIEDLIEILMQKPNEIVSSKILRAYLDACSKEYLIHLVHEARKKGYSITTFHGVGYRLNVSGD